MKQVVRRLSVCVVLLVLISACSSADTQDAGSIQESLEMAKQDNPEALLPELIKFDFIEPTSEEAEGRPAGIRKIENARPDMARDIEASEPMFRIYEASVVAGPATYTYDVWWKDQPGQTWLRSYDVLTNEELELAQDRTAINVGAAETYERYELNDTFKLEAKPGLYMAVRFELWHQPDNGGTPEFITEGEYIIQGGFN